MILWNGKRAALSITFDDGLQCQALLAAPELDKRDFRGTFFIVSRNVERDAAAWLNVAKRHEIGSHSLNHWKPSRHPDIESFRRDCIESKRILEQAYSVPVTSFAWPYALSTPEYRAACAETYKAGRGGHGSPGALIISNQASMKNGIFDVPAFNTCAGNIHGIPEKIENALDQGGWLTLMLHGVGDDTQFDNITLADFSSLLDFLKRKKDLWVAPYGEVASVARKIWGL